MSRDAYHQLAMRLDALPNGYPPTEDGIELEILARLFTPEEAELAAQLRLTAETPAQLAERLAAAYGDHFGDAQALRQALKGMAKRGLIEIHRGENGLAYRLMPFVVGFYEMQNTRLDAELAQLVETYMRQVFHRVVSVEPQLHRVLPVGETIPMNIDVQPYETAAAIINRAQAWGVVDCICRKQKALVGDPCDHPVEVCMVFSDRPGVFDNAAGVKAQTREESLATLRFAADSGLVHTVGNHQDHGGYICNCCTCSCGILRGVAELGMANVVARSAFVSAVDADLCIGCEDCVPQCQFNALTLGDDAIMTVDGWRCVGCGQCVLHCATEALSLARRPEDEIKPVPETMRAWLEDRAVMRGQDLGAVL